MFFHQTNSLDLRAPQRSHPSPSEGPSHSISADPEDPIPLWSNNAFLSSSSVYLINGIDSLLNNSSFLMASNDFSLLLGFHHHPPHHIHPLHSGSWIVRESAGSTPCLLGKAVDCNYIRGPKYLEIDVDIGSSTVANGVLGLVIGVITTLVVDMAFLVQNGIMLRVSLLALFISVSMSKI
ncbi:hypothetical protein WN943_027078 [Citrus x changshan-huyou]